MADLRSSSPQRVAELLTAAVPALSGRLLEETIRREWAQVAPANLWRRSEPGELRGGTLEVRVDNSPWLQEVSLRSGELLAALAARYGPRVNALRLRLGAVQHPDPAPRAEAPDARPIPRLSAEEAREVDALAATLPDPDLARALRRLLTKDRLARRQSAPSGGRERRT